MFWTINKNPYFIVFSLFGFCWVLSCSRVIVGVEESSVIFRVKSNLPLNTPLDRRRRFPVQFCDTYHGSLTVGTNFVIELKNALTGTKVRLARGR